MLLSLQGAPHDAVLALADGSVYVGQSIGAAGATVGEVVFNTAMTGYQEILTDPSYAQQLVTLTYPHIGNYGVNAQDVESRRVFAAGLIVRDLALAVSNFRATEALSDYLKRQGTVAISGIDTRQLTRHLRSHGAQNGCIVARDTAGAISAEVIQDAIARARAAPNMAGLDLAKVVSVNESYRWTDTEWRLTGVAGANGANGANTAGAANSASAANSANSANSAKSANSAAIGPGFGTQAAPRWHVVAYDFGIKFNILRMLAERGCAITVVPAQTSAAEVLALEPDGVFLSNGPGDPEPCDYAIAATRELIASGLPVFGICLGHQLMALALGAKTFKMKFGHHGANHPVKDLDDGRVSITSQNHGFAVDATSLPVQLRPTHVSLFDGTLQGLAHTEKPAFCFQGHPEASPGPHDIGYLFDRFTALMGARVAASVAA
ncbi:MAG: glutamine-hydrolyzing carbamoyl-phosphate synthase small subunit [Variovorax sp.]